MSTTAPATKTLVPVVYRWIEGEVIAVFPTFEANRFRLAAYAHLGQHCEIDRDYYYYGQAKVGKSWSYPKHSRSAKPEEYEALHKELCGIYNGVTDGILYELRICRKLSAKEKVVRG